MEAQEQRIVGSAEPLTPAETAVRLRELRDWGVDLSLVEGSLALTPTERIARMRSRLALAQSLRQAYLKKALLPETSPRGGPTNR